MKTCSRCGECKPLDAFYVDQTKANGLSSRCKLCVRAASADNYRINRAARIAATAARNKANPDRCRRSKSAYYWRNREAVLSKSRAIGQTGRDNLSDSYVKTVLTNGTALTFSDIPAKLVELKRQQLAIHRAVKQMGAALIEGATK